MEKAEILARLYNHAKPLGLGVLQYKPGNMTISEAQQLLNQGMTYFDYLKGRVMKIDVTEWPLNTYLYERDNGKDSVLDALTSPQYAPK